MFQPVGFIDRCDVLWYVGSLEEANPLLRARHYLGPMHNGGARLVVIGVHKESVAACQVWRHVTSRRLPADGSWLELSRWCLTPEAGENAGSRMHRYATRLVRELVPEVTTLVSYSDPSRGHTGALYRACNWLWAPTWMRLRPPPSGGGAWRPEAPQEVKDRWVFPLRRDPDRWDALYIDDPGAIRYWAAHRPDTEARWARSHPQLRSVA
jgi:hypothetical protein